MTKPRQSARLKAVHETAVKLFDEVYAAQWPARLAALTERRFGTVPGASWEGYWADQFINRPMLECNMVHLALIRVEDEWRNNRITVTFTAKDGDEGDLADTCAGLYRADEQDSSASEAYDNAVQEAIGGGMGGLRLRACYEDEYDDENTKQRVRFDPIYDADQTLFFDLNAKKQDKSDAKHGFLLTSMTRGTYEEEYDDEVDTWPAPSTKPLTGAFEWATADLVYVAEYYRIEDTKETVYTFDDIAGGKEKITETRLIAEGQDEEATLDDDVAIEAAIAARAVIGTKLISQKSVKQRRVHKYILSGSRVLEDCGYQPGKSIPLIPMFGKRWYIDNVEHFMGHVRLSMDMQRLFNMQLSKMAETAAKGSDSKPIFDPSQMDTAIMEQWSQDNIKNYPFLFAKALRNDDGSIVATGPLGMTPKAEVPMVTAQLIQIAQGSLVELLGSAAQPEQIVSNTSGKAVNMALQRQDARAFIFLDNAAKFIRRVGEVWLDYARGLYVESGRQMKIVSAQGAASQSVLSRPILSADGETTYENDLTTANFDVTASVGPSSSSKREAIVQSLTQVLQVTVDPAQASVLTAMILRNIEGEGLADLHEYERKKLLALGIGKPTEQDQAEAAQAQPPAPDAQEQFLTASAAQKLSSAELDKAKVALTEAQTIETLHGVESAANNPASPMQPGQQNQAAQQRYSGQPQQSAQRGN